MCLQMALSSRTTFNPLDYLTGKGSAQDFNRLAASIGSNIQKISKNGESIHVHVKCFVIDFLCFIPLQFYKVNFSPNCHVG